MSHSFIHGSQKYKAREIISCILPEVRIRAQIHGNLPIPYTTNSCESINHIIKLEVQWKESKLPVLINHLRSICERQVAEIEKAVIGRGEWRFDSSYRCLEVSEHIWFMKSDEQRKRHLTKVMGYECR